MNRCDILTGTGAVAVPAAPATATAQPIDPVVALFAEWRAAREAAVDAYERRADAEDAFCEVNPQPTIVMGDRHSKGGQGLLVFRSELEIARAFEEEDRGAFAESMRAALAAEFRRQSRQWWRGWFRAVGALSREEGRLTDIEGNLRQRITETPATSPAGIAGKIEVAIANSLDWGTEPEVLPMPIYASALADLRRIA